MNGIRQNSNLALLVSMITAAQVCCTAVAAPPYVILPSGNKIQGTSISADNDGNILLQTSKGLLTFPKGTKVVMDEPSDYTSAVQMMQNRQYEGAIVVLQKAIGKYRFLGWDNKAKALLASAYLSVGDSLNAVKTYEEAFAAEPGLKDEKDARSRYMKALLDSREYDKLKPLLDEIIADGPREAAAVAQIMRGNMNLAAGDVEKALYDFMRTAELFKNETEADLQAEANYETGECLEKLGDQRAAEYYSEVVRLFPLSHFALKARLKVK